MNKGRKASGNDTDGADIFADADFDADDFVEQMDDGHLVKSKGRAGWRRLEAMQEQRLLKKQLDDLSDWNDFDN